MICVAIKRCSLCCLFTAAPLKEIYGLRQRGRDFVEVGINRVCGGGAELLGGVRAGRDAPAGQGGLVRGLHVVGRVADEERVVGLRAEQREDVARERGGGLEPRGVGRADDGVEQRREGEVFADEARGGAELVGEHGGADAAGAEGGEQLARAGQKDDVVEQGGVPIRAIDGQRLGD